MWYYFFLGFFVKIITSLDDTVTRIPLISAVTRTRFGKLAFSIGNMFAIIIAIIIAIAFSSVLHNIPYYRYISAGLLFILAGAIYMDFFVHEPRKKTEKKIKRISNKRFLGLMGVGFIASFATVLDDIIAYVPVLLGDFWQIVFGITGILSATVVQLIIVIYFSEKLKKIKYKEEIAAIGLVVLGLLMIAGVI